MLEHTVDDRLIAVGERLLDAANTVSAPGLAAAHIGEVAAVVVVEGELLYNPRVLAVAEATEAGPEGSVSLPAVQVDVVRPVWAEITFMDATGQSRTRRFEGFAARVALHEIEQMQGRFFLQRVSRLKRDMALKRAAREARQELAAPPR